MRDEAAARARNAATEAVEWADKAKKSAAKAAEYAKQADANADAAEQSAKDAQASANRAKQAAATARTAARSANYSANRAVDAARRAVASANAAQASAAAAHAAEMQAKKDRKAAAAAASQAHRIALDKRKAEIAEAARKAAEAARKAKEAGKNPADSPDNDNDNVKGGLPWWKSGARRAANATNWLSIGTGFASALCGVGGMFFPPLEIAAGGFAYASLAFGGLNALFTGIGYGWTSSEFKSSLGSLALGVITFGQSKWIGALGGGKVATKLTQFGHDLVSPVTGELSSVF
ncbi:hypothetical protein [Streptomyces syringium]|uniref:hypothetical protein n=1 Tax=Streptomyces syringium TaxID=76729 RepID=UPI003AAC460C